MAPGGPINLDTVVCWNTFGNGVGLRFTNGGNNGYVGIWPSCKGWAAYFYEGSGIFYNTSEPDPDAPYPWECDYYTIDEIVTRQQSIFKPLEPGSCDASYSGDITLNFFDREYDPPPFKLTDRFFTAQFEVTRLEGITADTIHDVLNTNPFP
jgi:hypothetical protein